ncbi:hypothetical protein [Pseudomonas sp. KCJK8670]|uniref:hypothetical protein n=1 Tax=Pseudomonas sp. KCJK8670 TaxID=3344558 RepID=UPI0039063850
MYMLRASITAWLSLIKSARAPWMGSEDAQRQILSCAVTPSFIFIVFMSNSARCWQAGLPEEVAPGPFSTADEARAIQHPQATEAL